MRTRPHVSLSLIAGDDTTKAVKQRDGGGVNCWIGGICITADNALLFHELAKVATLAAQLQESCDEAKNGPHPFVINDGVARALRDAGIDPSRDSCDLCSRVRGDAIHADGGAR